jgi:hypothetical protein
MKTAQIIVAIAGVLFIALGVVERVYQPYAVGGCVLVGSALIAAAITNARRP